MERKLIIFLIAFMTIVCKVESNVIWERKRSMRQVTARPFPVVTTPDKDAQPVAKPGCTDMSGNDPSPIHNLPPPVRTSVTQPKGQQQIIPGESPPKRQGPITVTKPSTALPKLSPTLPNQSPTTLNQGVTQPPRTTSTTQVAVPKTVPNETKQQIQRLLTSSAQTVRSESSPESRQTSASATMDIQATTLQATVSSQTADRPTTPSSPTETFPIGSQEQSTPQQKSANQANMQTKVDAQGQIACPCCGSQNDHLSKVSQAAQNIFSGEWDPTLEQTFQTDTTTDVWLTHKSIKERDNETADKSIQQTPHVTPPNFFKLLPEPHIPVPVRSPAMWGQQGNPNTGSSPTAGAAPTSTDSATEGMPNSSVLLKVSDLRNTTDLANISKVSNFGGSANVNNMPNISAAFNASMMVGSAFCNSEIKDIVDNLKQLLSNLDIALSDCCLVCPANYERLLESDDCYRVHNISTTWHLARRSCLQEGGDLMGLHTPFKHFLLLNLIDKYKGSFGSPMRFYTSGNDLEQKGQWKWGTGDDAQPFSYSFWGPGAPSNKPGHLENCMEFAYNYGWNNVACHIPLKYICQHSRILAMDTPD